MENEEEALLNGISARTVPDLSIRRTGNVSKKGWHPSDSYGYSTTCY